MGKQQSVTITASSDLSEEEIGRTMEDAKVFETEEREKGVHRN